MREEHLRKHGSVHFGTDLNPEWRHPMNGTTSSPDIHDCIVLDVEEKAAWAYSHDAFHLISAKGRQAHDHGRVPADFARAVLVAGNRTEPTRASSPMSSPPPCAPEAAP